MQNTKAANNDNSYQNFMDATAAYMAAVSQLQAKTLHDQSEALRLQTNAQDAISGMVQNQADKVNQEIEALAEAQAHESIWQKIGDALGSALKAIVGIAMIIGGCLSGNPALIGIGIVATAMAIPGVSDKAIAGLAKSLGIPKGAMDVIMAVVETAVIVVATGVTGGAALGVALSMLSTNDCFTDLVSACGASDEVASGVGMGLGMIGTMVGGGLVASEGSFASLGDTASKVNTGLIVSTTALEGASSVVNINIGVMDQSIADYEENVMAPNMGKLTVYEALLPSWKPIMESTENAMSAEGDAAASQNRSFLALGRMYEQAV